MTRFRAKIPAVCFTLCCLISLGTGAEVTVHVRGPDYDGIDTTSQLKLPWPDSGPPVVWRRDIGQGYSGFIIVGNRAYTQVQSREGQRVLCLDLQTGKTIWQTRYDWPWQMDGDWPGPYATPTYSNGRIFFASALGLVGCMDADSGAIIWTKNLLKDCKSEGVHFGYACTPLVMNGKVYVPAGGKTCAVLAINADDGSTGWESGSDRASYTACMPITIEGATQVVSYLEIAMYGSNPDTGKTLWYDLWGSGYSPHGAWPLYREPYLYRSHPFRRGCRVDRIVQTNGAYSIEPVWQNREICADFFSSILVGDFVYGFDVRTPQADRNGKTRGQFVCIEFETGKRRWRSDQPGHTSVIAADGKLILLNERGELIICKPDPDQYVELARHTILPDAICWTMPTISHGYLLARNQREAVCVYMGTDPIAAAGARNLTVELDAPHWLDSFDSRTTWMPDWQNLGIWFAATLLAVFLPAWLLGLLVTHSRKPGLAPDVFLLLAFLLGIMTTRTLSESLDRFIFTWPAALYSALLWIQMFAARTSAKSGALGKLVPRILLIAFAGLCLLFWHICGRLFLIGGWGFLTGFLPAVLLLRPAAKRLAMSKYDARSFILAFSGFAIYFWVSAAILVWKAGLETDLNAF